MNSQDDFFTPEKIDRQIEDVSQFKAGTRTDADVIGDLRNFYRTDTNQQRESLDRIWKRIARGTPNIYEYEKGINMQNLHIQNSNIGSTGPQRPRRTSSFVQRIGVLAAAILLIALIGSLATVFYAARHTNGGTGAPTVSPTAVPTVALVPLKVTSVDMSVTPVSIEGLACGTNITVAYIATIHVVPNSVGGPVKFYDTVNNGRGQSMASVNFSPGQTTKTYAFNWSGALPADHTYPEPGGIQVFSPNQLNSQLVGPTGKCTLAAAFQVTSIDMMVSPTSIQGLACGTQVVVTYTATFHVAPNSPGGTVQFLYTVNNGRGQSLASINFRPGETSKTYAFTWSGALPIDHTYPEPGGVEVTSPNQIISPLLGPTGRCS